MDLNTQLIIAVRLLMAFVFGGLLGYERNHQQKPAGSRTHSLVCLGSALFMIVSIYGFWGMNDVTKDPGRIAAQVVTGMGFIGAGTIWKEGSWVKGLTTAATLWVGSALGLAIGAGLYIPAAVTAVLVFVGLEFYTLKRLFTGADEWVDRQLLIEELDLGSLKAKLERLFALPVKFYGYNLADPYIVTFDFGKTYPDPFTLTISVKSHTITLVLLYIPDSLRGQGYGRKVIQILIKWARNLGFLQINVTSKQEVEGMWLKLGFEEIGPAMFTYKLTKPDNTASEPPSKDIQYSSGGRSIKG